MNDYAAFLEAKRPVAAAEGFAVDPDAVNPALKPHIRKAVPWMLAGGRRALFARFGMQKTTAHLELMRLIQQRTPRLVVATPNILTRFDFRIYETLWQNMDSELVVVDRKVIFKPGLSRFLKTDGRLAS